ncbi:hypothetical protein [Flavobacterium sp. CGRL2]
MVKKLLLTSLLLNSFISFSQEVVNSTRISLKKNHDVFQTVNEDRKEATLFISDKIKTQAIQLDKNMKIVDSISTERPNTKTYDMLIGYNISNNNTRLFWSSNDYQEIFTQLYDIPNHRVVTQQYSLALKEEKVLQKFNGKDNFYILSILKKGNSLKLHIFDNEGIHTEKIIDFNSFNFLKSDNTKTDFYGVLKDNLFDPSFSMQKINTNNPTSLIYSSKKRKCYFDKKQITITIDTNIDYTQVLTIDLENFNVTEKKI